MQTWGPGHSRPRARRRYARGRQKRCGNRDHATTQLPCHWPCCRGGEHSRPSVRLSTPGPPSRLAHINAGRMAASSACRHGPRELRQEQCPGEARHDADISSLWWYTSCSMLMHTGRIAMIKPPCPRPAIVCTQEKKPLAHLMQIF